MTGSDVASIMSSMNRNDGFLEGNGIIILILFFLIFGFGGSWGNSTSNVVTTAELQNGLYNQTTNGNLQDIKAQLASNNTDMLTNVLQNRYDNSLQTQTLSNQMSSCCCEIKSLIRDETQSVKDLINNNTIQDLRDQLNTATIASANAVQTQNILGNIGKFYINQPINPYYAYGTYGSYSGTTIY